MDNTGTNVPHQNILFFLQEFQFLATPLKCHLSPNKTCIMTSTSGTLSLLAIKRDYGAAMADTICQALATSLPSAPLFQTAPLSCCPLSSPMACKSSDYHWARSPTQRLFCRRSEGKLIGRLQTLQCCLQPPHCPTSIHPMHPAQAALPPGHGGSLLLLQIFLPRLEQMSWPTLCGD
jgi:hypothetical protein